MIGVKPLFSGRSLADGANAAFDVVFVAPDGKPLARSAACTTSCCASRPAINGISATAAGILSRSRPTNARRRRHDRRRRRPSRPHCAAGDRAATGSKSRSADAERPGDLGRVRRRLVFRGSADTPDLLETAIDKPEYRSGDTMTVAVNARTAGRLTINVLGDRLLTTQTTDVKEGTAQVKVPVGKDWGTGAYVVATLRRPLDAAAQRMPGRAIGLQWFAIDARRKRSRVDIKAPPAGAAELDLRLPVKLDGLAAGEDAKIVVAAVDVGILNLTNYKPPAPDDYYLGQRALAAEIRDLYGQLDRRHAGHPRPDSQPAATQARELQGSPPTQKPLALYSGIVTVGADGTAEVTFDIPEFAGTVRVMAVAWSKDKVGRATADVTVRDPVVLTATLPRFLLNGDRGSLQLDLDNVEGRPATTRSP